MRRVPKKNEEGITLVALVVTIVVLLILAGITIMYVMGDNGVFGKASQAKIQTELAKIEEKVGIIYADKLLQKAQDNLSYKPTEKEIVAELKRENYMIEPIRADKNIITGISLSKESMNVGKGTTNTIQVTLNSNKSPYIYYVLVEGEYYKMNFNGGAVIMDKTPTDISGLIGETGTMPTLVATSEDTTIVTVETNNETNEITVNATEKKGTVTITVTYGEFTKTCNVKVCDVATGISLNEKDYVVTGGQSWINDFQLVAKVSPETAVQTVEWKSSNPEVATVNNMGLVKAGTKGGDAVITATTKDGSNKTAECTITTELFGGCNEKKTEYTDSDGNIAQIPDGYAVGTSENVNKVIGGLVTQDNEGNQFVWIPIGDVKKAGVKAFDVTLGRYSSFSASATPVQTQENYSERVQIRYGANVNTWEEPSNYAGGNVQANDLKGFIDNAIIDGGFWLGRFEVSGNTVLKTGFDQTPTTGMTQPNAASLTRNFKTQGAFRSDLANSWAWDTALIFIEKNGNSGYSHRQGVTGTKFKTGRSGDKVCNIFDMAGNFRRMDDRDFQGGAYFLYHQRRRSRVSSGGMW